MDNAQAAWIIEQRRTLLPFLALRNNQSELVTCYVFPQQGAQKWLSHTACGGAIENGLRSPRELLLLPLRAVEDVDKGMEAGSEKLLVGVLLSGSGRYMLNLVSNQGWKTHRCHPCAAVLSLQMTSSLSEGLQLLSCNREGLSGFCPGVFSHSAHSFMASIIFYVVTVLKS